MKKFITLIASVLIASSFTKIVFADGHQIYGPYPITLKGYDGDKTNSVKYTGQMARHACLAIWPVYFTEFVLSPS